MIHYPVFVEIGNAGHAYGVAVPDLPGCFSAGDTLDEAMEAAREAIAAWIDAALDDGLAIPSPSTLHAARKRVQYRNWVPGVVSIDPSLLDDAVERINITLPRRVLKRIDAKAREAGESRSGYIARLGVESK